MTLGFPIVTLCMDECGCASHTVLAAGPMIDAANLLVASTFFCGTDGSLGGGSLYLDGLGIHLNSGAVFCAPAPSCANGLCVVVELCAPFKVKATLMSILSGMEGMHPATHGFQDRPLHLHDNKGMHAWLLRLYSREPQLVPLSKRFCLRINNLSPFCHLRDIIRHVLAHLTLEILCKKRRLVERHHPFGLTVNRWFDSRFLQPSCGHFPPVFIDKFALCFFEMVLAHAAYTVSGHRNKYR